MSEPLFSVGENVILAVTPKNPNSNFNGQVFKVDAITHYNMLSVCISCGKKGGYAYRLPEPLMWCCACALRKCPPPDEEFNTFIKKLSLGKVKDKVPA